MVETPTNASLREARIRSRNTQWFPNYRPAHEVYFDIAKASLTYDGLILHLGAGRDSLRTSQRLLNGRLVSVDIDSDGLTKNDNPLRVLADAALLPFKAGAYDLVVCENVFEHLEDPEAVLRESYRALKEGGALVFLCPNGFSYLALLASLTPHRFHVWFKRLLTDTAEQDTFETHYRLNSRRQIRRLAQRTGFRLERLQSFVGWPTYWEFSDLLHWMAVVGHWLIERGPSFFHVSLVGILRKQSLGKSV